MAADEVDNGQRKGGLNGENPKIYLRLRSNAGTKLELFWL